ncbi:MAG: dihydropteroate synthase [Prevotella sp.]|nr:dihydropteroate synthase [Prevotella sp.]
MQYTLNIKGRLLDLGEPRVMGILNVTPDSFYAASRVQTERAVAERAREIVEQGGDIIDIGACSTRPGSEPVSEEDETARLRMALEVVRRELPEATVSVDTFRPEIARMAVEEYGADIINDVGGGEPDMLRTVSRLNIPYILMSSKATLEETLLFFADRVAQLRSMGQKDIILDPGFGFGKTLEQNYQLLSVLDRLLVMELPLLVGVSRKSMIYKLLDTTPEQALNGTTALNAIALMKGAGILRVHDVKEAVETCRVIAACGLNNN